MGKVSILKNDFSFPYNFKQFIIENFSLLDPKTKHAHKLV